MPMGMTANQIPAVVSPWSFFFFKYHHITSGYFPSLLLLPLSQKVVTDSAVLHALLLIHRAGAAPGAGCPFGEAEPRTPPSTTGTPHTSGP